MGDTVKDIYSGQNAWVGTAWKNAMSGNFGKQAEDMLNAQAYILDPGGLFYQNEDKGLAQAQKGGDIGGYGAKPAQEAAKAEEAAKKQKALVEKQNKKIDDERRKQKLATDERKSRMAQNQLLSGKETGVTLLGGL